MSLEVRATIDSVINTEKPRDEVWAITQRFELESGTTEELADVVTRLGLTWVPSIFSENGKRASQYWKAQQLFAIDVDSGVSVEKVIERSKRYNLPINFIYPTFSSNDHNNKFRVVWCAPVEITDRRVREVIQRGIMRIFPEADSQCKDAARMYFGSNKPVIYADYNATFDIPTLCSSVAQYLYDTDSNTASIKISEYCNLVGLNTVNGLPDVQRVTEDDAAKKVLFEQDYYRVYIEVPMKQNFFLNFAPVQRLTGKGIPKYDGIVDTKYSAGMETDVDWDKLIENCPVTRDFLSGHFIDHMVSFCIMANFIYLEGGERRFLDTIAKYEPHGLTKWKSQFIVCKKVQKPPVGYEYVKDFYPDVYKTIGSRNIVQTAKFKRGEVRVLDKPKVIEVTQAYNKAKQLYDDEIQKAIYDGDTVPVVIKVDTGVGKTEMMLQHPYQDITIAVPTHALKNDLLSRCAELGREVYATPEMPDESSISDLIDSLYKRGAINTAAIKIRSAIGNDTDIEEYVVKLDKVSKIRDKTIITTHARLPYLNTKSKVIVIDEDIIKTLVNQGSVLMKDFLALVEDIRPKKVGFTSADFILKNPVMRERSLVYEVLSDLSSIIADAPRNVLRKMPVTNLDMKKIEKHVVDSEHISSNVISFLKCSHFIKGKENIYFVQRNCLPKDKKIIVLSATADEMMYKLLFGESLRFHTVGTVALRGKLFQDTRHSYSRASMEYRKDETDTLIENLISDGYMVITFKDKKTELKDKASFEKIAATFGSLEGINMLKGQNIAIVGTPYLHPNAYLLTAAALGIELSGVQDISSMEMTQIERNGYVFNFKTYTFNKLLQHIHLCMIESELTQAIGRARLVRTDATVKLFSNYPIPQAVFTA